MSKTKKEMMQDKTLWEQMGMELAALSSLIISIQCDMRYQSVVTKNIFGKFNYIERHLDNIRGEADTRMYHSCLGWTGNEFFPGDNAKIREAVKAFRSVFSEQNGGKQDEEQP